MNTDRDTHEHVLRCFNKLSIDTLKITLLECLETKVTKVKITIVVNCTLNLLCNFYDFICDNPSLVKFSHREMEVIRAHFLNITRNDTSCQDFIIWVRCDHSNTNFSGKGVNFLCSDIVIHRRKYL